MSTIYDDQTAWHYANYRPPLHQRILQSVAGSANFHRGLDIGCGAGHSSLALAELCQEVLAIDISKPMLSRAIPHPRVIYQWCSDIQSIDRQFEVITLAGSWSYMKSQILTEHLNLLLVENGRLIFYDFEIRLDPVWKLLGASAPPASADYDYLANLDGLNPGQLRKQQQYEGNMTFQATWTDIQSLLKASAPPAGPGVSSADSPILPDKSPGPGKEDHFSLEAGIYYTVYYKKVS